MEGIIDTTVTASISNCFCCGKSHASVECRPYTKPNYPWTHFYICPDRVEPVSVSMVMRQGKPCEVQHQILREIAEVQGKPHCFAVFFINQSGGLVCKQFSENHFPPEMMRIAPDMLKEALVKVMPKQFTEPLRAANPTLLRALGVPIDAVAVQVNAPVAEAATSVETAVAIQDAETAEPDGDGEEKNDSAESVVSCH